MASRAEGHERLAGGQVVSQQLQLLFRQRQPPDVEHGHVRLGQFLHGRKPVRSLAVNHRAVTAVAVAEFVRERRQRLVGEIVVVADDHRHVGAVVLPEPQGRPAQQAAARHGRADKLLDVFDHQFRAADMRHVG